MKPSLAWTFYDILPVLKVSWYLSTQLPLGHFLSMIVVKGMIYISQLELWPSISQDKPTTNNQIFAAGWSSSNIFWPDEKYFLLLRQIYFCSTNIFFPANKFSWFYPGLVWSFSIFSSDILAAWACHPYLSSSACFSFLSLFLLKINLCQPRKNVLKYFQNFPAQLKITTFQ